VYQNLTKTKTVRSSLLLRAVEKTPAVFRFAATVKEESFKDPTQSIQLRVKNEKI